MARAVDDAGGRTAGRDRVLLAGVVFAVLFAQVLLYPGIPELVSVLGGESALGEGTWFLAAEFAAFVAFASVWGAVSDATGRRIRLIQLGAVGGALGYLVLATVATRPDVSFSAVLVLRALQGAMTIGAFSLGMTMLMDLPGGHGRNMGAAGIAIGLGTALGAPVGGQLTAAGAVAPLYAAGAVLVLAAGLAALVPERAEVGGREGVRAAIEQLVGTPALAVPYAFGFIDRLSAGFFALVGTAYFRSPAGFGLDAAATGVMLALFFAPFALLQYPFGSLSDRIGRTLPVGGGSLLYGIAVAAVVFAPRVEVAGALMVVVGVVGAFMAPATMALVTDVAAADNRGTAMGGFNIFGSLGFLVGIVAGGLIADRYGFVEAFVAVGSLEVLVAVVALPALLGLGRAGSAAFAGGSDDESPGVESE